MVHTTSWAAGSLLTQRDIVHGGVTQMAADEGPRPLNVGEDRTRRRPGPPRPLGVGDVTHSITQVTASKGQPPVGGAGWPADFDQMRHARQPPGGDRLTVIVDPKIRKDGPLRRRRPAVPHRLCLRP